ncbi:MAG: response regulator [Paracoccaceae bacterium]
MEAKIRILVVEDVERLAGLIVKGLRKAGFEADAVHNAADAREQIYECAHDAIVLDLGLPDENGLDLLRELREANVMLPILILTTRIKVDDRVAGLNAGADDYITKPFAFEELVARLRALLRRPQTSVSDVLCIGNLSFNTVTREAEVDGDQVWLTPKEQMLLEQLMRKPGGVVSKVYLEDNIYGTGHDTSANSLEVLTHRLRARLRKLGAQVVIHTVRGVGYMLNELESPNQ